MMKLKQSSVTFVHLVQRGEVLATIPVTNSQDLEFAKSVLLRYAVTLDEPTSCDIQVVTREKIVQSLI